MIDPAPLCASCGYNLTGLSSDTCPECGQAFDLETLHVDPELRRPGTPVFQRRCRSVTRQTVKTLLLMLFLPDRFARTLRVDEPLAPPIGVLLVATALHVMTPSIGMACDGYWHWHWVMLLSALPFLGYVAVVTCGFAALSASGGSRLWRFRQRAAVWFAVAAYSTVLAPLWIPLCAPTRALTWRDYTLYWPVLDPYPLMRHIATAMLLLWMTLILASVLWQRARPRWLGILLMLPAFLVVRGFIQSLDEFIVRLAR